MEAVFTFRQTRGAIGGEKTLLEAGIAVKVMALPSSLGAGCGLCLRVAAPDCQRSLELLTRAGQEPEGIYYKTRENGRTVYKPVS